MQKNKRKIQQSAVDFYKIPCYNVLNLMNKEGFPLTRYDKIAQMKPEQKNHWIEMGALSAWGERIFAEIAVCEELTKWKTVRMTR